MKFFTRTFSCAMYYISWFWFGAVGLALNVGCALLLPLPRTPGLQRRARQVIRVLFDLWNRWIHLSGVVHIRWVGFPPELPAGTVFVANHPTLLDATVLLARLPDAFCIFKPALMRNPCIAPAAILGGYVCGDQPVETIRTAAEQVAAGQSMLVFPEGTRTLPGTPLGPLKPGFAVIASRAGAPVQVLLLRASPRLVTRGRPWWVPPPLLPSTLEIRLGRRWAHDPTRPAAVLADEIERYLRDCLPDPVA